MQIALHLGAHGTDEDQIVKCLLKNSASLAERSIAVPEPQRYRPVIRETLKLLRNQEIDDQSRDVVLDATLDVDQVDRLILSHEGFLGPAGNALGQNMLYPHTEGRAQELLSLFEPSEVEFFLALRDPATFIPTAFARAQEPDFRVWTQGTDPMTLRWSDMVQRLRRTAPDAAITIWCNEDTPMILPQVICNIAGPGADMPLNGLNDFLGTIMGEKGLLRLETYLRDRPPKNETQRRRVVSAFLEKFASQDAIEQEIDLPGWTESYVEQISALYDEDVARIAEIPGVRLITP